MRTCHTFKASSKTMEESGDKTNMNRHNQARNKKTRVYGSEDMDVIDKNRVIKYLNENNYDAITNRFLIVPKDIEKKNYLYMQFVKGWWLKDWKIIARPDIICWHRKLPDAENIIIEIDGAVHKKELDSREIYKEYGIKHIIINKEYLNTVNTSWENYLDEKLLNA